MEIKDIPLVDTPDIFQQAVQAEMDKFAKHDWQISVLAVKVKTDTPYIDKTVVSTTYKAYLEILNSLTVVSYEHCSKPEWNWRETHVDQLIAGDIEVFLQHSKWFKPPYTTI
jgi:hypothetical protein